MASARNEGLQVDPLFLGDVVALHATVPSSEYSPLSGPLRGIPLVSGAPLRLRRIPFEPGKPQGKRWRVAADRGAKFGRPPILKGALTSSSKERGRIRGRRGVGMVRFVKPIIASRRPALLLTPRFPMGFNFGLTPRWETVGFRLTVGSSGPIRRRRTESGGRMLTAVWTLRRIHLRRTNLISSGMSEQRRRRRIRRKRQKQITPFIRSRINGPVSRSCGRVAWPLPQTNWYDGCPEVERPRPDPQYRRDRVHC